MTETITDAMTITSIWGQKTGCCFLDLPAEIRWEIYSHLFDSAKLSCETPHAIWPKCGKSVCSCLFPRHITSTCRQLRTETLPLLLAATTVEVAGSFDKIITMPESYLGRINYAVVLDAKLFSLRPFQLEKMPALKVLELRNITVGTQHNAYSFRYG